MLGGFDDGWSFASYSQTLRDDDGELDSPGMIVLLGIAGAWFVAAYATACAFLLSLLRRLVVPDGFDLMHVGAVLDGCVLLGLASLVALFVLGFVQTRRMRD